MPLALLPEALVLAFFSVWILVFAVVIRPLPMKTAPETDPRMGIGGGPGTLASDAAGLGQAA